MRVRGAGGNRRGRSVVLFAGVPTSFSFEWVFQADSPAALISAYFDPDHLAAQDRVGQLEGRVVVEQRETDALRTCTWRVTSQRPLPMVARPFVSGGRLQFLETMTWRHGEDVVATTVVPEILGGRVQIVGSYQLTPEGDRRIRRVYAGTITANITLVSGKIERGILEAFTDQMPAMAACTQTWLDRAKS